MSSLWDRFDTIASAEEVIEAKKAFEPTPAGEYDCVLESIEPAESKEGLPMLKAKFCTIEGNKLLFYNQMLQNLNYPNMTAVNIADAVNFVSGLIGEEVAFKGLTSFAKTVIGMNDIVGENTDGTPILRLKQQFNSVVYKLKVEYGKKDLECKFPKLKFVSKITDSEPSEPLPFDV